MTTPTTFREIRIWCSFFIRTFACNRTDLLRLTRPFRDLAACHHVDQAIVLFVTRKLVQRRAYSGQRRLRAPGSGPSIWIRDGVFVLESIRADEREPLDQPQRPGRS